VVWCAARTDTRRISIRQVSLPVHFTVFDNYYGWEWHGGHNVVRSTAGSEVATVQHRRRQREMTHRQTDRQTDTRSVHYMMIITRAAQRSEGGVVFSSVRLCVCLFVCQHDNS